MVRKKKNLQTILKSLQKDLKSLQSRKTRFGSNESVDSEEQKKKRERKKRRRRRLYYLLGGAAATGLFLSNRKKRTRQRQQAKAQQEDIKRSGLTSGEYHTKIAEDLQLARHRHKFKDPNYTPPKRGMLWTSRNTQDELDAYKNYQK
jgi:hypothetical protein